MTRTSCLATLSCAAVLLAIAGYGCGGSSDTIPNGSGGSGVGSGGSVGSGSGGRNGGGSGGEQGSGGNNGGGSGGTLGGTGGRDGGTGGRNGGGDGGVTDARPGMDARPGFDGRPGRDVVVREIPQRDAAATEGGIPMCRANARCTSGMPEPTCNEPCMIGTAMGERACACTRFGIVTCGQCRPAGGADGGGGN